MRVLHVYDLRSFSFSCRYSAEYRKTHIRYSPSCTCCVHF